MSDTTGSEQPSGSGTTPIVGIAALACAACCIGPILAVLGAIAALGLVATMILGAGGLLIAAAATAAFLLVRRRRRDTPRAVTPERATVELTWRGQ